MLLDQETQLISAIGRHKLEADTENKDKRIQDFLDKVCLYLRFVFIYTGFISTAYLKNFHRDVSVIQGTNQTAHKENLIMVK